MLAMTIGRGGPPAGWPSGRGEHAPDRRDPRGRRAQGLRTGHDRRYVHPPSPPACSLAVLACCETTAAAADAAPAAPPRAPPARLDSRDSVALCCPWLPLCCPVLPFCALAPADLWANALGVTADDSPDQHGRVRGLHPAAGVGRV